MNHSLAQKIYTKQGVTKENVFEHKKVLHIGCGNSKLPGAIGVDMLKMPAVDVVHDLDVYPWPFEDNSIDGLVAHSVMEHVTNIVSFFDEVSRISKQGARVVIEVPYFRCVDSFTDPTHKHFFTSASLDYFLENKNSLSGYGYSTYTYIKRGFWYGWPQQSSNLLVRWFKSYIEKHAHFYDQYLSMLFPVKVLFWELEVKK